MGSKKNTVGLIAIAAALVGLIAFFLNWVEVTSILGSTAGDTGFEMLFQEGGKYSLFAVAIFIGLVGIIIPAFTEFRGIGTGATKFMAVLLAAVVLMGALMIFLDAERDAAIGLFIELAVGVILLITALAAIVLKPSKS
jgi:hypothetical protein